MKILLVSFEFPPYPLAGVGLYALNLVKTLKGHEITVITPNHSGTDSEEKIEGATVKRVNITSLQFLNKLTGHAKANRSFLDKKTLFARALKDYIKKEINLNDYDIFHSLNERDAAFLDFESMNKQIPTVVSVNDYYILGSSLNPLKFHFKSTDLPLRYVHHNIMKYFYKRALQRCTKIIPNCHFVGNLIKDVCKVDDSKIRVIHRGIDTKKFNIPASKTKYKSKKILFVGPNAERKGAIFVVKALPSILKEHPETTLTVIGSCPLLYKRKMLDFVKEHNLQSKFIYIEHLPQDQLLSYYKEANVFIMPSIMEAMGQVYLEAMTAKTPVIGANVGGVGEIITPEVGFLVKPQNPEAIAQAVNQLFSDSALAEKMGKAGHERATGHFSIERQMKETLEVYVKLTS